MAAGRIGQPNTTLKIVHAHRAEDAKCALRQVDDVGHPENKRKAERDDRKDAALQQAADDDLKDAGQFIESAVLLWQWRSGRLADHDPGVRCRSPNA